MAVEEREKEWVCGYIGALSNSVSDNAVSKKGV